MDERSRKADSAQASLSASAREAFGVMVDVCERLAWGETAQADRLFALTRTGEVPAPVAKLAEAFGLMLVKVEARDLHREELLEQLRRQNRELERAYRRLGEERNTLVRSLCGAYEPAQFVGQCPAMREVVRLAVSIAPHSINVLILGPTGAGKEVFAKILHYNSPRSSGPFVALNCSAVPESLFESEVFGIESGVATGVHKREGLLRQAHGGTLFLDEIADMSPAHQAKFLRVLEAREVVPVGGSRPVPVDVRIVCATNRDLERAVADGSFREDLFYRVHSVVLNLPPLAERGEDILILARRFLAEHTDKPLSPEAGQALLRYDWPGNVRELRNEMERAAVLSFGPRVEEADLSPRVLGLGRGPGERPAGLRLDENERRLIHKALERAEGNKTRAAELLGITREGLRKKLLRHGGTDAGG
jgi:transcriptional regulator with PAS, ATPase and Fis domain